MGNLIIDMPDGRRWQCYTDKEKRLILKSGDTLKNVMDNVDGSFDGVFNSSGILYIVATNQEGGIDCITFDEKNIGLINLVSGKSDVSRISGIRILYINGSLSMWYCLEYDSNLFLVNQFFDSRGKADAPFAVDRLGGKKCFSVCCDGKGGTNIFYKDKDGFSRYLRYNAALKRFEPGNDSLFSYDDVVSISSICDDNNLHLVFVARRSDYYGVYYKNAESPRELVLGFGVGAGCNTSVCSDGKNVRVYWTDNYECCECFSNDGGKSFGKPKRISYAGDRISLCNYRCSENFNGLYMLDCLYREENETVLNRSEIDAYFSRKADKIMYTRDEIADYAEKNAHEVKVGIDFAARLEGIETQLMKIVYILEEFLENKGNIRIDNGGNDIETV